MQDLTQNPIFQSVMGILLPVIGSLVSAFSMWALAALAKKFGMEKQLLENEAMRNMIRAAIAGAEEKAARELKITGQVVEGRNKLAWVADRIGAATGGIPSDLKQIVDEELARMSNVGATGARVISLNGAPPPAILVGLTAPVPTGNFPAPFNTNPKTNE